VVQKRWRFLRIFGWVAAVYALASVAAGITLAEISLHLPKHPLTRGAEYRARVRKEFNADVADVSITAADGAVLRGWFVQPAQSNGQSVILLHGITDNRFGIAGFGDPFLQQGYSVLLPDSREHGESGGAIATYGIMERDDVRRWVGWMRQREPGCTYLFGESMGAEIGVQATAVTPQLCAAVVESPYSEFREVGYERLGWETDLGTAFWKTLGRPVLQVAITYVKLRYKIYLPDASPKWAVEHSRVPVLFIAGTADRNIQMHHAQELERACGTRCSLWIVRGADHGAASTIARAEFNARVMGWIEGHGAVASN
jgi:alpha-beta hydrolase superfamily lysophospholipase